MSPEIADPERALAVSYAPADRQAGLAAVFAYDERLGGIVGSTSEPMIGLMRLAWWRERVEALGVGAPPAEPLLTMLAGLVSHGSDPLVLAEIEDGWAALLDGAADAGTVARHGRARGRSIFRAAGALLGAGDAAIADAGEGWALADLAHRHSDAGVRALAAAAARDLFGRVGPVRWSRAARPLGALAALARIDAAATGPRRQGSPGRLARMLALRLTGR